MTDKIIEFDEDEHFLLLASFIESHAKPTCEVIVVDPGRGRKAKLSDQMLEFGFTSSLQKKPSIPIASKKIQRPPSKF